MRASFAKAVAAVTSAVVYFALSIIPCSHLHLLAPMTSENGQGLPCRSFRQAAAGDPETTFSAAVRLAPEVEGAAEATGPRLGGACLVEACRMP